MATILEAIEDPALFRPFLFKDLGTWRAWLAFLRGLFALPLGDDELGLFKRCTGRTAPLDEPAREAAVIVGRRGGKSFIVALVGVYLACFRDWRPYLAPGERATVMLVACDRKQARVIFRYVMALLRGVPMLDRLIERETAEAVELTNQVSIEIHTASFRSTRGYTVVAFIGDESAFWRNDESANPDREIVAAVRPAMATVPGALLLLIGSPYAQRGVLFEMHRDYHGRDDAPALIWWADTETMNPTIDHRVVAAAYARDPLAAASEYGAQFRTDLQALFDAEVIERAVQRGMAEITPQPGVQYHAFADPSGGARDSFTLAIAHAEDGGFVLDVCRAARPPFSPEAVVKEFAALLKVYGCGRVTGDKYAGQWPVEAFGKQGILYEHSERTKSDIYLEALPLLMQGAARLLDDRALLTELHQLERRTARGGRDSVDHPPGGHDDRANAACGALVAAAFGAGRIPSDAFFGAFNSAGEQVAGTGQRGFQSAFDEVEKTARELEARPWSWNPTPPEWD